MILFIVQSVFGLGHMNRVRILCNYLNNNGITSHTICAGAIDPRKLWEDTAEWSVIGFDGTDYSCRDSLYDATGLANKLISLIYKYKPRILVFEYFPFGRMRTSRAVLAVLESLKDLRLAKAIKIVCSVRDIPNIHTKNRLSWIDDLIDMYFDAVYVHGDQTVSPPEPFNFLRSAQKVKWTGYVADLKTEISQAGQNSQIGKTKKIVIDSGGGAYLQRVLTHIDHVINSYNHPYKITVCRGIADTSIVKQWSNTRGIKINISCTAPNKILNGVDIYISACGYNTFCTHVQFCGKSIIIPCAQHIGDNEQHLRSQILKSYKGNMVDILGAAHEPNRSQKTDPINLNGAQIFTQNIMTL